MDPLKKAVEADLEGLNCEATISRQQPVFRPFEKSAALSNQNVLEVTPLLIAETQVRGLARLVEHLTTGNMTLQNEVRHARKAESQAAKFFREERRLLAFVAYLTATNVDMRKLLREANEDLKAAHVEKECAEAELEGVRESLNRLERAEEDMARELDMKKEENEEVREALRRAEKEAKELQEALQSGSWTVDIEGPGWQTTLKAAGARRISQIVDNGTWKGEDQFGSWLW